jgi:hypothetical protein
MPPEAGETQDFEELLYTTVDPQPVLRQAAATPPVTRAEEARTRDKAHHEWRNLK